MIEYILGGKTIRVPEDKVDDFLSEYPDAKIKESIGFDLLDPNFQKDTVESADAVSEKTPAQEDMVSISEDTSLESQSNNRYIEFKNGQIVYEEDYLEDFAGNKNYPETFDEYAKSFKTKPKSFDASDVEIDVEAFDYDLDGLETKDSKEITKIVRDFNSLQNKMDVELNKKLDTYKSEILDNEELFEPYSEVSSYSIGKPGSGRRRQIKETIYPYEKEIQQQYDLIVSNNKDISNKEAIELAKENVRQDLFNSERNKEIENINQKFIENAYQKGGNEAEKKAQALVYQGTYLAKQREDKKVQKASEAKKVATDQAVKYNKLYKKYTSSIPSESEVKKDLSKLGLEYIENSSNVKLEDGGSINENIYNILKASVEGGNSQFSLAREAYSKEIEALGDIRDLTLANDVASKNYALFEKYLTSVGVGFLDIGANLSYLAAKSLTIAMPSDNPIDKFLDESAVEYYDSSQEIRNSFVRDVSLEDSFSSPTDFGKFWAQEISNQIPILATMVASGGAGSVVIGASSMGGKMIDMQSEIATGKADYSGAEFLLKSLGYGLAEGVFSELTTIPILRRAGANWRSKAGNDLLDNSTKEYFKTKGELVLLDTVLEPAGEIPTQIAQNLLDGVDPMENVDHAGVSGFGMGLIMSGIPFLKGVYTSKFSTYKNYEKVRNLQDEIKKQSLKYNQIDDKTSSNARILAKEIKSKQLEVQEVIVKAENIIKNNLTAFHAKKVIKLNKELADLQNDAKDIQQDETLDRKTKQERLNYLKKEFEKKNTAKQNSLSEENMQKYAPEFALLKETDPTRYNDLIEEAGSRIEGKYTPELIEKEAYELYLREEVISRAKKAGKVKGANLEIVETIEEAIEKYGDIVKEGDENPYIELNNGERVFKSDTETKKYPKTFDQYVEESKSEQKSLTYDIFSKGGVDGFKTPETKEVKNGKQVVIPSKQVVIVEAAVNNQVKEIGTHEVGHYVTDKLFEGNEKAYTSIAKDLMRVLYGVDKKLHDRVVKLAEKDANGNPLPAEIIARFTEIVAEGKADYVETKKIKGLAGFFGQSMQYAFSKDYVFDFKGENDIYNFVVGLGKKISNGEINLVSEAKEGLLMQEYITKAEKESDSESEGKNKLSLSSLQEQLDNLDELDFDFDMFAFEAAKTNLKKKIELAKKKEAEPKKETKVGGVETDISDKNKKISDENKKIVDDMLSLGANKVSELDEVDRKKITKRLAENNRGLVEKLVKRATSVSLAGVDDSVRIGAEEFRSGYEANLAGLINSYDYVKNKSFGAYINEFLPKRYGEILKAAKKGKIEKTSSISDERVMEIAASESTGPKQEARKKYTSIINSNVVPSFTTKAITEKLTGIINSLKSKITDKAGNNAASTPLIKEIKSKVGKVVGDKTAIPKLIRERMGKFTKDQKTYEQFLIKNKKAILENMTTTWLMTSIPNAVEKSVGGKYTGEFDIVNIAGQESKYEVFKPNYVPYSEWKGAKIDREGGAKRGITSGNELVRRVPASRISDQDFVDALIEKGNNKKTQSKFESLSKALAEELSFEVISRELKNPNSEISLAFENNQQALGVMIKDNIAQEFNRQSERGLVKFSLTYKADTRVADFLSIEGVDSRNANKVARAAGFTKNEYDDFVDKVGVSTINRLKYITDIEISVQEQEIEYLESVDDYEKAYSGIKFSISKQEAYKNRLRNKRPDLSKEQIDASVQSVFDFRENNNAADKKKSKLEKLAFHYMANGFLILPEDGYKVIEAEKISEAKKIDPFSFKNPNELIEKYAGEVKKARTNPDKVKEFTNKEEFKNGVVTYDVQDSKNGQLAVREVIDTNWGKKSNPWCLAARDNRVAQTMSEFFNKEEADQYVEELKAQGYEVEVGFIESEGRYDVYGDMMGVPDGDLELLDAFERWQSYNDKGNGFKISFKDGKLLSFRDGNKKQWWDRMDNPSNELVYEVKEKGFDVNGQKTEATYSVDANNGSRSLVNSIVGDKKSGNYIKEENKIDYQFEVPYNRQEISEFENGKIKINKSTITQIEDGFVDTDINSFFQLRSDGDIKVKDKNKTVETTLRNITYKYLEIPYGAVSVLTSASEGLTKITKGDLELKYFDGSASKVFKDVTIFEKDSADGNSYNTLTIDGIDVLSSPKEVNLDKFLEAREKGVDNASVKFSKTNKKLGDLKDSKDKLRLAAKRAISFAYKRKAKGRKNRATDEEIKSVLEKFETKLDSLINESDEDATIDGIINESIEVLRKYISDRQFNNLKRDVQNKYLPVFNSSEFTIKSFERLLKNIIGSIEKMLDYHVKAIGIEESMATLRDRLEEVESKQARIQLIKDYIRNESRSIRTFTYTGLSTNRIFYDTLSRVVNIKDYGFDVEKVNSGLYKGSYRVYQNVDGKRDYVSGYKTGTETKKGLGVDSVRATINEEAGEAREYIYNMLEYYKSKINKIKNISDKKTAIDNAISHLKLLTEDQSGAIRKLSKAGFAVLNEKGGYLNTDETTLEHSITVNDIFYEIKEYLNDNTETLESLKDLLEEAYVNVVTKVQDKILTSEGLQSTGGKQRVFNTEFKKSVDEFNKDGRVYGYGVVYGESIDKEQKAINNATEYSYAQNPKGISVWDFDDTLARTKSNVLYTMPDGTKGKLDAAQFAARSEALTSMGAKFDFSEFSKVMKGKKGPMFDKAIKRNKKFGNKNVYILTARPADSKYAIHEFLKGIGLDIRLENIVGLADGNPKAKASWMITKVAEGYNDFYFADDHLGNVKAVGSALEQLGVKRKVRQAVIRFSKSEYNTNKDPYGFVSYKAVPKEIVNSKGYKKWIKIVKGTKLFHGTTTDPNKISELGTNHSLNWFIVGSDNKQKAIQFAKDVEREFDGEPENSVLSIDTSELAGRILPDADFIDISENMSTSESKIFADKIKALENKYKTVSRVQPMIRKPAMYAEFLDIITEHNPMSGFSQNMFDNNGKLSNGAAVVVIGGLKPNQLKVESISDPTVKLSKSSLRNDKAIKDVLNTFDVKGKVQQAKIKFSKSLDKDFNDMLERNKGVSSTKEFSPVVAKRMAKNKGMFKFWMPASLDDFRGLTQYIFAGKGKQGEADQKFFQDALITPYFRGIKAIEDSRQTFKDDFKALNRAYKPVLKKLGKLIPNGDYTYDQAIRVMLWKKSGYDIPGLSKKDEKNLVDFVESQPDLLEYVLLLQRISKRPKWAKPEAFWDAQTIISDLNNMTEKGGRKEYISEFIENVDIIFSEKNLLKIKALYGEAQVSALKDIIWRMKNGTNRTSGMNKNVNRFNNWVNNSIGAIMFFNRRSALLQTLSTVNFINWSDNNMIKAGAAFANQPQFWKDFAMIFNSAKLKQRRSGLKSDVNEAEIASAVKGSKNKAVAALSYLLKKGFLPTQMVDSFAIASGGATFYRNRVNTYLKQGMELAAAEKQAFEDFSQISEETQQSGDPALISSDQASALGRLLLAFQNTPIQLNRSIKKAALDIKNRRRSPGQTMVQSDFSNLSKIIYYGAIQNIIFSALQNALFALIPGFGDDDDELTDEEQKEKYGKVVSTKQGRIINGISDTLLKGGFGVPGAFISTAKNMYMEYDKQEKKKFLADHTYTILAGANLAPPVGSKLRKIYSAIQTNRFEKDVIKKRGWDVTIDGKFNLSPSYRVLGSYVEGSTNIPLDRIVSEVNAITEALDSRNTKWQRLALAMGWKTWDVSAKNEEHDLIKTKAKAVRKKEGIEKAKKTRNENNKKIKQLFNKLSLGDKNRYKRKRKDLNVEQRIKYLEKLNNARIKRIKDKNE